MSMSQPKPRSKPIGLKITAWTNAMRYIERKGKNTPTGFVIPRNMWNRVKRILGKQVADLTAEDTDFIRKMMEGVE